MGAILTQTTQAKNSHNIIIRTATVKDAKAILGFNEEVLAEAPYLLTTREEFTLTLKEEEKFLSDMYDHKNKLAIVAELDGKVVGFLDFHGGGRRRNQHDGTLGMSVREHWRNQALVDLLLRALFDWVERHETVEKVSLEVFSQNIGAIHLYIKQGFVQEGRKVHAIKLDDGQYMDLIIMGRILK
ncbi:LOW QUALITY PROTEIN: GNAT family acetyltransferase YhhY [Geomicrobium sp. JCM 19055]|nr:LOW QUALITY PROTEIN: GNAT family acetyltransferase YhhY [Geomicrobium sp. JCM 19055]